MTEPCLRAEATPAHCATLRTPAWTTVPTLRPKDASNSHPCLLSACTDWDSHPAPLPKLAPVIESKGMGKKNGSWELSADSPSIIIFSQNLPSLLGLLPAQSKKAARDLKKYIYKRIYIYTHTSIYATALYLGTVNPWFLLLPPQVPYNALALRGTSSGCQTGLVGPLLLQLCCCQVLKKACASSQCTLMTGKSTAFLLLQFQRGSRRRRRRKCQGNSLGQSLLSQKSAWPEVSMSKEEERPW